MRRFTVLRSVLAAALLFSLPQDAFPQAGGCVYGDSAATNSLIAELVAGEFHQFGSDTVTWPHEFNLDANDDFKAFRQVFDLWLTNHPSGRFSTPQWEDILHSIMNNDTTGTRDDVFSYVWDYFTREEADLNDFYAGVRFYAYPDITLSYTRIRIWLYDPVDIPGQQGSTSQLNNLVIDASSSHSVQFILGQGIAHELQHVCYHANGEPGTEPVSYKGLNESLSTIPEYMLDAWRPMDYNLSYDASFMDDEHCDIGSSVKPKYKS